MPACCAQVDAALDLSHTQNIGRMIKTHFPYSQFIVVSLKEGMFSNANVLFRTKFVDGISTVTRTATNQKCATWKVTELLSESVESLMEVDMLCQLVMHEGF